METTQVHTPPSYFDQIANLECEVGHKHFAPDVYLDYWTGRECGTTTSGSSCKKKMRRIPGVTTRK